jgi:hypothetical protein
MKYTDPHTYVQLISTNPIMNELGKTFRSEKIEKFLTVTVEGNKTSYRLPNGKLHGITKTINSNCYITTEFLQEYSLGVLMSEQVCRKNPFRAPVLSNCVPFFQIRIKNMNINNSEEVVYKKTYNHKDNQFLFTITENGKVVYEGEYLITTNEKHGKIRHYSKEGRTFKFYHRNKLFSSNEFLGNKLFKKIYQIDDWNYKTIIYNRKRSQLSFITDSRYLVDENCDYITFL